MNYEYELLKIENRIKLLGSRQKDNMPVIRKLWRKHQRISNKMFENKD